MIDVKEEKKIVVDKDASLEMIADEAVRLCPTNTLDGIDVMRQWIKDNPKHYKHLKGQAEKKLCGFLYYAAQTRARRRIRCESPIDYSRSVKEYVSKVAKVDNTPETRRSPAGSMAACRRLDCRLWDNMVIGGKKLPNCTRNDLRRFSRNEKAKGKGHIAMGYFADKMDEFLSTDTQALKDSEYMKLTNAQIQEIYDKEASTIIARVDME